MIAAVQLKRYVAGAGVFCIIIGKFSYWKEPCPLITLKVDENSKIAFYCTILPFGLGVSLRLEGYGKSPFDFEEVTKR